MNWGTLDVKSLHSTIDPWESEKRGIYLLFRGIGGGIVLIGSVRSFVLLALGFELEISTSQVLHSTTGVK